MAQHSPEAEADSEQDALDANADPEHPPEEPVTGDGDDDDDDGTEGDDFGPPFTAKTFGGAFVWARAPGYVATVLRVREGGNVEVSTENRRDMIVMLTGGRAVLEVDVAGDVDHVELMPAAPVPIDPDKRYRLIAQTEVELFTVYSPLAV
jgi:hypothetical protein